MFSLYSVEITLVMASLHELRDVPVQGDYFLSFDDLLEVIRDASIKHKFSFKTPHKDLKRVRYRCANTDCPWKINAHRNPENNNEVIVDEVTITHTCVGDAITWFISTSAISAPRPLPTNFLPTNFNTRFLHNKTCKYKPKKHELFSQLRLFERPKS